MTERPDLDGPIVLPADPDQPVPYTVADSATTARSVDAYLHREYPSLFPAGGPAETTDPDTAASGWHRPDVETAALEHLTTVVGPVSARQLVDGLLARGRDTAAKGSPAGAEPTLSSSVLDLLTAIRDALDVPRPAPAQGFDEVMERRRQREALISDRATSVRIAAHVAIELPNRHLAATLGTLTQTIRDSTAALPVEYEVRQDPAPGAGGGR